jgi:type IV secretion system protein VirB6
MQGGFVNWIMERQDQALSMLASNISDVISTTFVPVVGVGLSITLIMYCWAIMRGVVEMPIQDFLQRILVISLVTSFACASGIYAVHIIPLIQSVPTDLANTLAWPGAPGGGTGGMVERMDITFDGGMGMASTLVQLAFKSGIDLVRGFLLLICAVVFALATLLFVGIGLVLLMVVKVALALLAAIGPIFIFSLLFATFRDMFARWLGQIVNFTLLIMLFSVVYGFQSSGMSFILSSLTGLDRIAAINMIWMSFAVLLYSVASLVVLYLLPGIAASLSGGISVNAGQAAASAGRLAMQGITRLTGKK